MKNNNHNNVKLAGYVDIFISKRKRDVISSVGYGVGISFLVFTLLFSYYSPFKSTSLLTYRSSFQNHICFSKSSQNVFSISWHFCYPNSTATSSDDSLLQDKETNVTKTAFTNETVFNEELDNNSTFPAPAPAPEAGDNSLVRDGESVDTTTNNDTGISVPVLGVHEEELVNNVTASSSDPQLGNYTNTTAIDSTENVTDTAAITTANEEQECDIFDGQWVLREDIKPYYPEGSCPYIDKDFDCYLNKRPNNDFLKWQWQPKNCNVLRLNATDFLERMRGKRMLFIGDSLNRNMWESLNCILRNSVRNKKKVYEISGRMEFKKKGVASIKYEDYNCYIEFIHAPFLVSESKYFNTTNNQTIETLRLDWMNKLATLSRDADFMIFNSWHWWNHFKTGQGENYFQVGRHVYPKLGVLEAYEKALATWRKWIDKNIDSNKTQVIFRSYSVTHFSGGKWNTGGKCNRVKEPILDEPNYIEKYPAKLKILEDAIQRMKTPVLYLNITRLTYYRADAHPSIYRKVYKTNDEEKDAAENSIQDCNHWCLPGIPDIWNELLYNTLLKIGRL
ncbi:protein trichome birefringence-like 2 [Papaver somniferum]|uniref:protein trichome birefringence-like 2 n=1 Tax=Papaver somniferum TaxID=3469 RepID=UPI000E6FCAEB|nr:protein trichome birefringence-like 2 [Papaver somniferum]